REITRSSPAARKRIGHSPPSVFICGLTRPSTSVIATAASIALPPALRMSAPALAERYEFDATPPFVPIRREWNVVASVGAMRYARSDMLALDFLAERKIAEAVSRGEHTGRAQAGASQD